MQQWIQSAIQMVGLLVVLMMGTRKLIKTMAENVREGRKLKEQFTKGTKPVTVAPVAQLGRNRKLRPLWPSYLILALIAFNSSTNAYSIVERVGPMTRGEVLLLAVEVSSFSGACCTAALLFVSRALIAALYAIAERVDSKSSLTLPQNP